MSTKAREFWIRQREPDQDGYSEWQVNRDGVWRSNLSKSKMDLFTHVIEYSAYDELRLQNEIMSEAIDAALRIKDLWLYSGEISAKHESESNALSMMRLRLEEALAKCGNKINKYPVKWNINTHIHGKVYDLTQENMNAMILDIEILKEK